MTGSSKQTTTSNSAPWAAAQPALKQGISEAQKLSNNGTGAQVYTGSTVVPWDAKTVQGMDAISGAANANIGGRGLSGQYQDVINNGGYNAGQLEALNNTRAVANGSFNINEDPGFQQVVDQATNAVNSNASAAGRYGSGANQQLLGNTIGDLGARQYQAWQQRKDAANSNLFNMGQQGFGNLSSAYTGMQAPAQSLMQVGAMNEDLATRQLNDKLRIFNDKQNKPWENLSRLNAIASGAGQLGGSQTTSQPGQNPFLTALGYGATGAGLLGGMF
ncbi:structural protein [Rhizobium phage RHph_N3_2]|nr:structural protein [Rhizobium phage RHph_N3_2]